MRFVTVTDSALGPRYLVIDAKPGHGKEVQARLLDESIQGIVLVQENDGKLTEVYRTPSGELSKKAVGPEHEYLTNPNVRTFLGLPEEQT